MRGTGHALLLARSFVGSEPFIVAYPDDLHFGEVPLARQLIATWEKTGCTVLATLHDPPDVNRYGLISIAADGLHVTDIIEKPPKGKEPSREASIGRFLYTPDFLEELASQWARHGSGEFFHTPGVLALARRGRVVFKRVEGERLDTGEPSGYLEAILRYADTVPELRAVIDRIIASRRPRLRPAASAPAALPSRIALIGFMGSGKSTVGRILARSLGYGFVDMDSEIEKREGMSIPRIFEERGEAGFPTPGDGGRGSPCRAHPDRDRCRRRRSRSRRGTAGSSRKCARAST